MSVLTPDQVLLGPFSVERHKETFTNYLEVVITPNGRICYAVPSHQQWLERYYHELTGRSAESDCPRDRWADYLGWLMDRTGCVCVWTGGVLGRPNAAQRDSIGMLKREGLISE